MINGVEAIHFHYRWGVMKLWVCRIALRFLWVGFFELSSLYTTYGEPHVEHPPMQFW